MSYTKEKRQENETKRKNQRIENNTQSLLSNKWVQQKHIKHSTIQVAHYQSTIGTSTSRYPCYVCCEYGARYEICNKRKYRNKDTGVRLCGSCVGLLKEKFPVKYDYCR